MVMGFVKLFLNKIERWATILFWQKILKPIIKFIYWGVLEDRQNQIAKVSE